MITTTLPVAILPVEGTVSVDAMNLAGTMPVMLQFYVACKETLNQASLCV